MTIEMGMPPRLASPCFKSRHARAEQPDVDGVRRQLRRASHPCPHLIGVAVGQPVLQLRWRSASSAVRALAPAQAEPAGAGQPLPAVAGVAYRGGRRPEILPAVPAL